MCKSQLRRTTSRISRVYMTLHYMCIRPFKLCNLRSKAGMFEVWLHDRHYGAADGVVSRTGGDLL